MVLGPPWLTLYRVGSAYMCASSLAENGNWDLFRSSGPLWLGALLRTDASAAAGRLINHVAPPGA